MDLVKSLDDFVGERPEKFYKTTLFSSQALLIGLNCLEPGQVQKPHDHDAQDKFYFIVEGSGIFWLGEQQKHAGAGQIIWAPAGLVHGVENTGKTRLTLLVGIAPAP